MSVVHPAAINNGRSTVVSDATDAGTTNSSGAILFLDAVETEVARCVMSNPAWQAPVDGVMDANAITDDTSAAGGTVTSFNIVDRDDTVVASGTVTGIGGGGDIEMSSTTVGLGDTVSVTSLTYDGSTPI